MSGQKLLDDRLIISIPPDMFTVNWFQIHSFDLRGNSKLYIRFPYNYL